MDMPSSTITNNPSNDVGGDMEGWKPYLHTSLFTPGAFSNIPDSGEAFLFPSFRIYSRTTFLLACLFTFSLALLERYFSYLLDSTFSLHHKPSSKRKNSTAGNSGGVYISIPTHLPRKQKASRIGRLVVRTAVYFIATLIRYVLMIIGMGMDWFLLVSLVSGLTLGHVVTDLYTCSIEEKVTLEEVELLPHPDQDQTKPEAEGEEREWLHRRSSSRQGVTPF